MRVGALVFGLTIAEGHLLGDCRAHYADNTLYVTQCIDGCNRVVVLPDCKHPNGVEGMTDGDKLIECVKLGQPLCDVNEADVRKCRSTVGNPSNPTYDAECKSLCVHYGNKLWHAE